MKNQTGLGEPVRDWFPISFMSTFSDFADLVHGPNADWGQLSCGCHPNCGIGMAVMCDKETKEYRPVTAFLNADQLARDVAKINDGARSKKMSVFGVSLALLRNYNPYEAPTHFRLSDLIAKFDKCFGMTGKKYGKVTGDRTMDDIEMRRKDRWNFLFIAGMWFQDLFNYDFRRTEQCIIPYATQEGEISFCAYNTGVGWRNIIEKMHMTATLTKWYEDKGRHEIIAGGKNVNLPSKEHNLVLRAEDVNQGTAARPRRPGHRQDRPRREEARPRRQAEGRRRERPHAGHVQGARAGREADARHGSAQRYRPGRPQGGREEGRSRLLRRLVFRFSPDFKGCSRCGQPFFIWRHDPSADLEWEIGRVRIDPRRGYGIDGNSDALGTQRGRATSFATATSAAAATSAASQTRRTVAAAPFVGMAIESGSCGSVDLSGVKCAAIVAWPKAIHEGHGQCVFVVEPAATEKQIEALGQIFTGKLGGMPWELLGPTFEVTGLVKAKITIEGSGPKSVFKAEGVGEGRDTLRTPSPARTIWPISSFRTDSSGRRGNVVRGRSGPTRAACRWGREIQLDSV